MMLNELEAHRRTAATELGEISYLDVGEGPAALFVHGVFTNAVFWRNVLAAPLAAALHRRRPARPRPDPNHRVLGPVVGRLGAGARRCAMRSTSSRSTSSPTTPAGPSPRSSPPPTRTAVRSHAHQLRHRGQHPPQ